MAYAKKFDPMGGKPLRLWPGIAIVVLQWVIRFLVPAVVPEAMQYGIIGGLFGGLAIVVWWAFFSRAPRFDRWGMVLLMIVALALTPPILHESIKTGAMGMLFYLLAIPGLCLAFVVSAVASRHLSDGYRRATMAASILLACGFWALVRTGGFTAEFESDFAWRWAETPEERLLALTDDERMVVPSGKVTPATVAGWPGFRGPERDGTVRGVQIEIDWSVSPPAELWRRKVGPGWSSFAVLGNLFYTQEQRGDDEVVTCYNLANGEPVWMHRDTARFWESNAGAGPRGTPTISDGRVYTFGATGILNVLDAVDGAVVWSRNAASDTGAKLPTWGFSSSPLVVDDVVVVAPSGALVAYDKATGKPRWFGPAGDEGYSSPHFMTIEGIAQIIQLSGTGIVGLSPADGTLLWEHPWSGFPIVQPALSADGEVLMSVSAESGIRRIAVAHHPSGWSVEERWTSIGLKPYYSDFVVHHGHAFGFDGSILACVDLKDGMRKWKGGRYGAGQILLLADQDLLLVLTEKGELALVEATPNQFTELARLPAIKSKTWNHPVLVGDVLLVRNAQEMAAFRLSLSGTKKASAKQASDL